RIKQDITTEYTRNRSRSAEAWNHQFGLTRRESRRREHVGQRCDYAAHQVEDQITNVAQAIFDVVAEDPKEQHVAGDVGKAAVHEHRRKERQVNRTRRWTKSWHVQVLTC